MTQAHENVGGLFSLQMSEGDTLVVTLPPNASDAVAQQTRKVVADFIDKVKRDSGAVVHGMVVPHGYQIEKGMAPAVREFLVEAYREHVDAILDDPGGYGDCGEPGVLEKRYAKLVEVGLSLDMPFWSVAKEMIEAGDRHMNEAVRLAGKVGTEPGWLIREEGGGG